MPQGACRGYGTIRPATPTDCRYAESIHRICHRPAASRASKTHFSGLGPPWRSHPCIEGYPQCHRVRAVGMERSDRQHQPIADTQSRFTVYVTGLLPEAPKRIFRVWGRHGGPILVLRATHSARGCVPWTCALPPARIANQRTSAHLHYVNCGSQPLPPAYRPAPGGAPPACRPAPGGAPPACRPAPGGAPPACRPAPGGTPRRCPTCARGGTARGLP